MHTYLNTPPSVRICIDHADRDTLDMFTDMHTIADNAAHMIILIMIAEVLKCWGHPDNRILPNDIFNIRSFRNRR